MGNTNRGTSTLGRTTPESEASAEQPPAQLKQSQPEGQQEATEQHAAQQQQQEEGAVALPSTPGKVEQFEREEEPSRPPRDFEGIHGESSVDPEILEQITGFVYHEMELVYNIHLTMKEMENVVEKIENARRNIRESSEDLNHTYTRTSELFRSRSPLEEFVERAISKLEENISVQEKVTEGFSIAADRINNAVRELNQQVKNMTSVVVAKMPQEIIPLPTPIDSPPPKPYVFQPILGKARSELALKISESSILKMKLY